MRALKVIGEARAAGEEVRVPSAEGWEDPNAESFVRTLAAMRLRRRARKREDGAEQEGTT